MVGIVVGTLSKFVADFVAGNITGGRVAEFIAVTGARNIAGTAINHIAESVADVMARIVVGTLSRFVADFFARNIADGRVAGFIAEPGDRKIAVTAVIFVAGTVVSNVAAFVASTTGINFG